MAAPRVLKLWTYTFDNGKLALVDTTEIEYATEEKGTCTITSR